ncbi:MarR family transcriptional regulator [Pleomorphomonas diazotrophica]|uniref:MarR family transcriptional regulator n=1 Tax=Pleomorphomonas diazotrophica TaxID=1166257 RepID=A0A1I4W3K8_9HYPH|nr:MarR family transcriptional regulator [Pleomorphomonas diazotrophica]PKR87851.1 MarR family transcriptional regulator [Pleomorphomonas diazotrophica]SFN08244.1 DNA-binding transcriptional regulator, MarR family [Pleomorphomonas diazotrophica]
MAGTDNEPTAEALALGEELRRVVGGFVRSVRRQADTPSSAQSETLALLDRQGPMSVAALAAERRVKHQSMRLVVAQLEEGGLVTRLPNPEDGRSHLLALSDKGRAALERSRAARRLEIAALIGARLTGEERRLLRAAIGLIEKLS